tara:strand:- start:28631 stop:28918 length:288 start_codon:yes stop_codon:yes gene_type:complete
LGLRPAYHEAGDSTSAYRDVRAFRYLVTASHRCLGSKAKGLVAEGFHSNRFAWAFFRHQFDICFRDFARSNGFGVVDSGGDAARALIGACRAIIS